MTCIQIGDLFYWQNAGMTKHLVENYLKEIVLKVFVHINDLYVICL